MNDHSVLSCRPEPEATQTSTAPPDVSVADTDAAADGDGDKFEDNIGDAAVDDEDTIGDDIDFETVPASWITANAASISSAAALASTDGRLGGELGMAQEAGPPMQERLERFSSLARGNSVDGLRHSRSVATV